MITPITIKCKKFISYSLYGKNPKYTSGMIKNCEVRNEFYPEFDFLIYYDSTVPSNIIDTISNFTGIHLIKMSTGGDELSATKMMWRFEEFFSNEPKIVLSRDADSLLNIKERLAVEEWLRSDNHFHIMRDHPWHTSSIMGGMCGIRVTNDWNLSALQKPYSNIFRDVRNKNTSWGFDQNFLNTYVYPVIKNTSTKHCSYNKTELDCIPFPKCSYNNFVGNYI